METVNREGSPWAAAFHAQYETEKQTDDALVQAMLDDLLIRNRKVAFEVVLDLASTKALARDRFLCMGVVSSLCSHQLRVDRPIPPEVYDCFHGILKNQLNSRKQYSVPPEDLHRRILELFSASRRWADLKFMVDLHAFVDLDHVGTVQAAIQMFLSRNGPPPPRVRRELQEFVAYKLAPQLQKAAGESRSGLRAWRKNLNRLRLLLGGVCFFEWATPTFLIAWKAAWAFLSEARGRMSLVIDGMAGVLTAVSLVTVVASDRFRDVSIVAAVVLLVVLLFRICRLIPACVTAASQAINSPLRMARRNDCVR